MSKVNVLVQEGLTVNVENAKLFLFDQNKKLMGERPFAMSINAENEPINKYLIETSQSRGFDLVKTVDSIIKENLDNKQYDTIVTNVHVIMYSEQEGEWIAEPRVDFFETMAQNLIEESSVRS